MSKKYLICLCLFLGACVNPAFRAIQGKSPEDVRAIKGEPVTILTAQNHEMWTYRQATCTQVVFFDENNRAVDFQELGTCQTEE